MLDIVGIINSISIAMLAATSIRHTNKIRKNSIEIQLQWKKELQEPKSEIMNLERRTDALEDDCKNIRLEMKGIGKRQPVPQEYFEKDFCAYYDFGNGRNIKRTALDYIADIGLKAIASELPEEKRTPEIVEEIIKRMRINLQKVKIISE